MNQQNLSDGKAEWCALMLRAIASNCKKGVADVNDSDVLTQIADEIEALERNKIDHAA